MLNWWHVQWGGGIVYRSLQHGHFTSLLQHQEMVVDERSRPRWGRRAWRCAWLRGLLTVCGAVLWLWVQQLSGWLLSDGHGGECAGWGGPGLLWLHLVWGRLNVLPKSLKRLWRQSMAEKWTCSSQETALVDVPADRTGHYLKTRDIRLSISERLFIVKGPPVGCSCRLISMLICHSCEVGRIVMEKIGQFIGQHFVFFTP